MRRTNLIRVVATAVAAAMIATVGWVSRRERGRRPQPLARQGHLRQLDQRPVRGRQPQRRQPGHLLGERRRAFPQWAQVDLGASTSIDQVVLKLPDRLGRPHPDPVRAGQPDGVSFTTIVASAGRAFNPASNNAVTINFTATSHPVRAGEHHREHRLGRRAAVRAGGLRHQPRSTGNLAAGPADHRERPRRRLRLGQRRRRQPGHLLGERQQLLPGVGDRSTSARRVASTGSCSSCRPPAGAPAPRR